MHDFKIYKKLNQEVIFNSTNGGTIADIQTGAIFCLMLGSNGDANTDITATWTSRARFDDS